MEWWTCPWYTFFSTMFSSDTLLRTLRMNHRCCIGCYYANNARVRTWRRTVFLLLLVSASQQHCTPKHSQHSHNQCLGKHKQMPKSLQHLYNFFDKNERTACFCQWTKLENLWWFVRHDRHSRAKKKNNNKETKTTSSLDRTGTYPILIVIKF